MHSTPVKQWSDATSSCRLTSVCFLYKLPEVFSQLIYPCWFPINIKSPLVNKLEATEEIIIAVIEVPKRWGAIVPCNLCKVTIFICYSVVFKTDWYWIHGSKIESSLEEKKGLLISNLPLCNLYFFRVGYLPDLFKGYPLKEMREPYLANSNNLLSVLLW